MKAIFVSIITMLCLSTMASAGMVGVGVSGKVMGTMNYLSVTGDNPVSARVGFHNIGSLTYGARARMDVIDNGDIIFTGWSSMATMPPSDRQSFDIFWHAPERKDNLTFRIRVYYGNEMEEREVRNMTAGDATDNDPFSFRDFSVQDESVSFKLYSNSTTGRVFIYASGYPPTWIFEQARIDGMDEGRERSVKMNYYTDVFSETNITISAMSEDGMFYGERTFLIERHPSFWESLWQFFASLLGI